MTEGLKSEALSFWNLFFEKIPPACLNEAHLPLQGRLFSAKRWAKSSSLSALFALYRKKVPGKIPIPFPAQKERLDGFSPVVFALRTVYFMSLFASQKDGRRVRVSPNKFIYTKRKSTKEKSLCFFWRRRRDSTGFQPVVFALRTVYFMSLFAPQKDGRRVRVSCPFCIIQKKGTGENPDTFFGAEGETRTLAPVTRPTPLAGAPRHQLEYFCIGSVYDTIQLLKEIAEKPLSLLSGGESGIRTHGTLPYDGFQDRSVITASVSLHKA